MFREKSIKSTFIGLTCTLFLMVQGTVSTAQDYYRHNAAVGLGVFYLSTSDASYTNRALNLSYAFRFSPNHAILLEGTNMSTGSTTTYGQDYSKINAFTFGYRVNTNAQRPVQWYMGAHLGFKKGELGYTRYEYNYQTYQNEPVYYISKINGLLMGLNTGILQHVGERSTMNYQAVYHFLQSPNGGAGLGLNIAYTYKIF